MSRLRLALMLLIYVKTSWWGGELAEILTYRYIILAHIYILELLVFPSFFYALTHSKGRRAQAYAAKKLML